MTKLKIKEKINKSEIIQETLPADDLESGNLLYSYNYDMILLVMENQVHEEDFTRYGVVNVANGELMNSLYPDAENFEDVVQACIDDFGPFYLVDKAKITFKVGE